MNPIDYRNETWESVRARVSGLRQKVYDAYMAYGPATTRELSQRSGIDLLTLRPRTTELTQLGLCDVVEDDKAGREAIYVAVPLEKAQKTFEFRKAQPVQQEIKFA
jgi:hypothetical protein